MKRVCRLSWFVLLVLACGQSVFAGLGEDRFHEGAQYQRIDPPLPLTGHENKVEVVEMFFYACPHCNELEPKMQRWLKDKPYIDFHRMPAIVGPSWADQARAYYMAGELGRLDELHPLLFKAIHEDGKQMYNEYAVIDFFVNHGVTREKALELYYSNEILEAVNDARIKTIKYGLRGVPAVIVNGKYKTAPYFVHNQEEMFEVLDSLVEKERKQKTVADKFPE